MDARYLELFAQLRCAGDHARTRTVDQTAVDGEEVVLADRSQGRIRLPDIHAAVILFGRREDRLGILLQHGFDADDRRRHGEVGEYVLGAAQAQRVADDLAAIQGVQGLVPDLVKGAHDRTVGVALAQVGQLAPQIVGGAARYVVGAHQLAQLGDAVRNVLELLRLAVEHRNAELAHHLDLAFGLAVAPHDDQVGFQGDDALQVDLAVRADLRNLLRVFRKVAVRHDADHVAAAARGEQQLRDVRRQRNHTLRRLLQGDAVAVVVLDGDGGRGDGGQGGRQRGHEQ
jgi:hypothetical protein